MPEAKDQKYQSKSVHSPTASHTPQSSLRLVDTPAAPVYTDLQVRRIATAAAEQAVSSVLASYPPTLHFDNGISQEVENTPLSEDNDMAKRQRFNITLPSGEKIWITGETISEAFANGLAKYGSTAHVQNSNAPTVREFVEQTYIPTYYSTLKPTTRENYTQYLELDILPFMGDMRMDEVDVSTIQRFYNWMATAASRGRKKNLNADTITRVSGLARRIFRIAFEMKLIPDMPFKTTLLRITAEEGDHHKALPDAEIARVKQAIPKLENEEERAYMALLAYTGMRLEEILGLRWEDMNLDEQYCIVRRAVTHPKNSQYHIDTPKSKHSGRTVLLPKPLVDILKPLEQSEGFLFGGIQPWCYSHVRRTFARAKKALGPSGYNNHDFRTTFATQLSESGLILNININAIQNNLNVV